MYDKPLKTITIEINYRLYSQEASFLGPIVAFYKESKIWDVSTNMLKSSLNITNKKSLFLLKSYKRKLLFFLKLNMITGKNSLNFSLHDIQDCDKN